MISTLYIACDASLQNFVVSLHSHVEGNNNPFSCSHIMHVCGTFFFYLCSLTGVMYVRFSQLNCNSRKLVFAV